MAPPDRLYAADSATLSLTGNHTIAFWINYSSVASLVALVNKFVSSGNQQSWLYRYGDNSGTKQFIINLSSNGSSNTQKTYNYTLSTGTWYHMAFVYTASAGSVGIYLNGVLLSTQTGLPTSIYDSTAPLEVGGYDNGGNTVSNATFDEIGLWSRALTADEVSQLYNSNRALAYPLTAPTLYGGVAYYKLDEASGNAADSIGSRTLTNTGSVTYGAAKINNGAIGTNTTDGYLKISDDMLFTAASSNTWNFWYKYTTNMTGYILDNITNSTDAKRLIVYEDNTNKKLHLFANGNEVLTQALTSGVWYMITITKSGTNWELFTNTSSNGTTTTGSLTYSGGVGFMLLNSLYTGGSQTTSMVDEILVANRVLSSGEISTLYNAGAGLQYPWAAAGPANIKTIDNLAIASVKTVDNLATASVKTYNSLA